jgi:hypothetical protein
VIRIGPARQINGYEIREGPARVDPDPKRLQFALDNKRLEEYCIQNTEPSQGKTEMLRMRLERDVLAELRRPQSNRHSAIRRAQPFQG